jgi:hypothetical protein
MKRYTASSELRLAVKLVADASGRDATVAKFGLSWDTIARLMAGLSVSPKTLNIAAERVGLLPAATEVR